MTLPEVKPHELERVATIKDLLKAGKGRSEILEKHGKTWKNCGRAKIDAYIRIAKAQILQEAREMEGELQKAMEAEIEAKKEKILTEVDLQIRLSEIVTGSVTFPSVVYHPADGKFVTVQQQPSAGDTIRAIQELNKIKGVYAPSKSKVEVTERKKYKTIIPGETDEDDEDEQQ